MVKFLVVPSEWVITLHVPEVASCCCCRYCYRSRISSRSDLSFLPSSTNGIKEEHVQREKLTVFEIDTANEPRRPLFRPQRHELTLLVRVVDQEFPVALSFLCPTPLAFALVVNSLLESCLVGFFCLHLIVVTFHSLFLRNYLGSPRFLIPPFP